MMEKNYNYLSLGITLNTENQQLLTSASKLMKINTIFLPDFTNIFVYVVYMHYTFPKNSGVITISSKVVWFEERLTRHAEDHSPERDETDHTLCV